MTTTIYGTQVTAYYTAAQAAFAAGGAPLNIAGGSVIIGDGGGVVPLLSQLIANGGCLNPIAGTGAAIASVAIDSANSAQIDIGIVVPATVGGVETGPFTVREFCIYDALGNLCAVGVTNLEKSTSSQGQIADLAWTASIVTAVAGAVIVTPPSAGFATVAQVQTFFNANLPTATAPLTQATTTNPQGWLERVFGIRPASQPVDPVTAPKDAAATGYGRPASAAEFSSGTPFAGGFPFPWATIQQVHAALSAIIASISALGASISAITIPGAAAPLFLAGGEYQIEPATTTALGVGREATLAEAEAGATAGGTPAPAFITPEALAAALATPFGSVALPASVLLANNVETVLGLTGSLAFATVSGGTITITKAGLYVLSANLDSVLSYGSATSMDTEVNISHNGTIVASASDGQYQGGGGSLSSNVSATVALELAAGDTIQVAANMWVSVSATLEVTSCVLTMLKAA